MENKKGHLAALLTIIVWGTTFISTKVLLRSFSPIEILFTRFFMGFIALFLFSPKRFRLNEKRQEWYFMGAGLCGVTLYYLLENFALTYSFASNIGIILAVAPFFTALCAHFFLEDEKLKSQFFIGFVVAITGVGLISFNGASELKLNPLGDLLALAAAFVWAVYSILLRKITSQGYNTILVTRRIFFWGLLFMIPTLFLFGFHPRLEDYLKPVNLCNFIFLGFCACAVCFITWNYALKILGAVKTSVYIYVSPVVTIITAALVLHERITKTALFGTALILAGLILSERKSAKEERK